MAANTDTKIIEKAHFVFENSILCQPNISQMAGHILSKHCLSYKIFTVNLQCYGMLLTNSLTLRIKVIEDIKGAYNTV